jgi:hypothetical protein
VVVASEAVLYLTTAGSATYRIDAVARQSADPIILGMVTASQAGGGYFTDPLLMLVSSHEFGAYHLAAALAAPILWTRWPAVRPLIVWWVAGYVWHYYGTTMPTAYVPLQRDPRYVAFLSIPAVTLVAGALWLLRPAIRWTAASVILAAGVLCAGFDSGPSATSAHGRLEASKYAAEAGVEPSDYYAARWEVGLDRTPSFRLVDDAGRKAVVDEMEAMRGTVLAHRDDVRYFVFSPLRRPDLVGTMRAQGWRQVDEIKAEGTFQRRQVGRLLAMVPGQERRAERLTAPPGLLVVENPARREP